MNSPLAGAIGLCLRARQAVSGAYAVEQCIRRGGACLVLYDPQTANHTRKTMEALCAAQQIPCRMLPEAGLIEQLTAKAQRKVLAITNQGFAEMILGKL